jgi:rod shape-determining protein MreC
MWLHKYRILLLSLWLIVMAMVIISSHRRHPGHVGVFDRIVYGAAKPMQWSLSEGLTGLRSIWEGYFGLIHMHRENRALRKQVQELEARITDYQELKAADKRLRRLLGFRNDVELPTVAAQVIGEDSTGWFHTLLIDKGQTHGIRGGMPVVVPDGIVGQTLECADRTSKVLLIVDRNSAVDIMIQRSRTRGILEGTGKRDICVLKYVTRTADAQEGDRVITSGLGGIYPKGLLVGRVISLHKEGYGLFQKIEVAPQVDFDRLEEVLVVLREQPLTESSR